MNSKYLTPTVVDEVKALRHKPIKEGFLGNDKMAYPSEQYPKGRNTYDYPGCGRAAFGRANGVTTQACYLDDGKAAACYAEAEKALRGGSVAEGRIKRPVQDKALRKQVMDYYLEAGGTEGIRVDSAVKKTQGAFRSKLGFSGSVPGAGFRREE